MGMRMVRTSWEYKGNHFTRLHLLSRNVIYDYERVLVYYASEETFLGSNFYKGAWQSLVVRDELRMSSEVRDVIRIEYKKY